MFRDPKQDLDRKLREAALAVRLQREWPKKKILIEYLNTVYFGQGSYGVKAAAERYFGVPLEQINLSQAALLAGLIKNPEGDNPFVHKEAAFRRRAYVLNQMYKQGAITKRRAQIAMVQDPETLGVVATTPAEFKPDNYYTAQVRDLLIGDAKFGLGATNKERENKLNLGGLHVYTAYDSRTELLAQAAIDSNLPESRFKAAIAAIDPGNGDVKAIVAGPDLNFTDTQYNLATMPLDTGPNPEPTGRQPGSTFKAIVLAAALENGFSVKDSIDGTSPCTLKIPGYKGVPPRTQNAEGSGGVQSLRSATENSVNCAYFRLGAAVGLPKIVEMATRLGVTHPINPAYYSLSIGSSDGVSPLDMATVFATLAADGVHHDPTFIKRVEDSRGKVLYQADQAGNRAIDPQIARTVTDVLRGVITDGTATRARLADRVAAGKTGTTDGKTNAWFVGYTPQLVAAVWMGNPQSSLDEMRSVGRFSPVYGGTWPAVIWKSFMSLALAGEPDIPFIPPDQKLWPFGRYVSEAGRGKTSYNPNRSSTQTTKPLPFFGFPPPRDPTPPATSPPGTTPSTAPPPPGP